MDSGRSAEDASADNGDKATSTRSDKFLEVIGSGRQPGRVAELLRRQLGKNVRALRLARGLTQEKLAEQLGLSSRYLAGIERGERNLSLDSVDALARSLGVDSTELLASI